MTTDDVQRILSAPTLVSRIEHAMLRELARAWELGSSNPYVQRIFRPGLVAVSADMRPAHHRSPQARNIVCYWVDPVCYVVDALSGFLVDTCVPIEGERRLIEYSWLDRGSRPPTARIEWLAKELLQEMEHPENRNGGAVASPILIPLSPDSGKWRITPPIPRVLTQPGAHIAILIAKEGEVEPSDDIYRAIEHLGILFPKKDLQLMLADPLVGQKTVDLVAECLAGKEPLPKEPLPIERFPQVPSIPWDDVTGTKIPPLAMKWWERLFLAPTIPKNGIICAVMGLTAARALLEILFGSGDAPWRRAESLFTSGTVLEIQWARPEDPRVKRPSQLSWSSPKSW